MSISGLDTLSELEHRSMGQLTQEGFAEINHKAGALVRGISSIATGIIMLPVDRIVAQQTVGKFTRASLSDIAKRPFLGAIPRLMNAFLGSFLTFGGSAAFHAPLQERYPHAPYTISALALAGGSLLDRIVTTPLGTLGLRMQTQNKTFMETLRETIRSGRPWRSIYAGTFAMMLRDVSYLPVCIPAAEKLTSLFAKNNGNSSYFTQFVASTAAFVASGTAASFFSHPLLRIGLMQKDSPTPISMKKVFTNTLREHGPFGVYRGFKAATGRMAAFNFVFAGAISLGEHIVKKYSSSPAA